MQELMEPAPNHRIQQRKLIRVVVIKRRAIHRRRVCNVLHRDLIEALSLHQLH